MTLVKRVQASYSENNGSVLPGYLPSVGFAGGMQPSLGYTLGSQADIRYEAARQGWLTGFPNFNQSFSQMHSSKLKATAQLIPMKGLIVDFNADRDYMESRLENFKVTDQTYIPRNSNVYGNFGMSTILGNLYGTAIFHFQASLFVSMKYGVLLLIISRKSLLYNED